MMKTKLTKILLVLPLALFIFSFPIGARDDGYCHFSYKVPELSYNSVVCARKKLSESQLDSIRYHVRKTLRDYPRFIHAEGYNWQNPLGTGIVVLSEQEMNSSSLFRDAGTRHVFARFFPEASMMYVTESSLKRTSLDLPHELAHLINYNLGIFDVERDESLAYRFESSYFVH